ncbi:MAG: hypothetical protein JXA67_10590 [Micromonosporaceae bacterium]|nr:hypothetical protein [Micromonosporaceae bacterium]
MLSNDRHRRASGGAPRSGGRTAGRLGPLVDAGDKERLDLVRRSGLFERGQPAEPVVVGSTALKLRMRPEPPESEGFDTDGVPRLRVAPPTPVRTARAPFIVLVLVLVMVGVVGILVLNTKINENVFRLHDLHQTQTTLDTQEQQLEADLAEQAAPGTVAGKARELGMRLPTEPPTFIILPDGQKLDVPQPAVGK